MESGKVPVPSLVYSMGIDAENIMRSLGLEEAVKTVSTQFWGNLTIISYVVVLSLFKLLPTRSWWSKSKQDV